MMIIENDRLKVACNIVGGSLTSVFDKENNRELLWQGEAKSWASQDILIFPFIGKLVDGYYLHEGNKYSLDSHGLLRRATFTLASNDGQDMTLTYSSNEETLKRYPFAFCYSIRYKLDGNTLSTTMKVENKGNSTMYFGCGAHPAYNIIGDELGTTTDTSGNSILFECEESPKFYRFTDDSNWMLNDTAEWGKLKELEITKPLLVANPTIIFENIQSKKITLKRRDGVKIDFEIGKVPVLALWSHNNFGSYVCIEPWFGIPDLFNPTREIKDKRHINSLKANEVFEYTYKTII